MTLWVVILFASLAGPQGLWDLRSPPPETELAPHALEAQGLDHWPTREVTGGDFKSKLQSFSTNLTNNL